MIVSSAIVTVKKVIFVCAIISCIIFDPLLGQELYINEFLASNVTINADIVDFDDYSDWVEIYNDADQSIDLNGYFITDDLNDITKWEIRGETIIPAKGYIRFWADGMDDIPGTSHVRDVEPFSPFTTTSYHLNFKLSRGGEEIGLYNPEEILVDTISYGLQSPDVSYGRKPDGGSNWYYFGEPTPGSTNASDGFNTQELSSSNDFSLPGGFYSGTQFLVLSSEISGAEIRYAIDGRRPTSTSPVYNAPIQIESNTVIRARLYEPGKLPGPIVTHSYFINETPTLPVLSISAFWETLWDNEIGIYTNSYKGREIPVSIEYFEEDGDLGFKLDAGMRISGQGSYLYPQKPMTISARSRFGTETINYQLFPDRETEKFSTFYLRNSGTPDNRRTLFRDALQHTIVINQMDLDVQAYQPAITFINGEYWGIYNIREKLNAEYIASLHNIDPTNLDYLEYDFSQIPVILEGDVEDYNSLLEYMRSHDLSVVENFETVSSRIDIDEYINYVITEIFCDNINWLNTNVRWWRERREDSKWRWIMLDNDWGFGTLYPNFTSDYHNNTFLLATSQPGSGMELNQWATFIFRKLLENTGFRDKLIQRFASHLNTTFERDRLVHFVDSLKANISSEMPRHIDRWNDSQEVIFGYPPIPDVSTWNQTAQILRTFADRRTEYQRQHIISFFGLSGQAELSVSVSNSEHGVVEINSVPMPDDFTGFYFKDIPVSMVAVPTVGYRFVGWSGLSASTSDSISIMLNSNDAITAIFEPTSDSLLPSIINGNTILALSGSPYLAPGDITVNPGVQLLIEAGVNLLMPQDANLLVYGTLTIEGSSSEPVIIRPNSEIGAHNWGALCLIDGTSESRLSNFHLIMASHGPNPDKHMGAISSYNSDSVIENVEILDSPFPIFIQYGNAVIKDSRLHSEHTSDLINIKYAQSALVENCDLRGNVSFDTDAIDYDQINGGIIRGNKIYNFHGFNSDGIDLGESSKDILIENNLILNCFDKGISVGQASTVSIKNNIIVNCGQGVGIKDESSYALIDHNTFYGNVYAVASFEKNFGEGGGHADVTNSILSRSTKRALLVDDLSILNVTYSLSDSDELNGSGNINSNPVFRNNFHLSAGSPSLNTGDPSHPQDPDGSRTDMGAVTFDADNVSDLMFTEIHYNPANGEEYEFIELFNSGSSQKNLTGYSISEGINFTFPTGANLDAGDYAIIAKNSSLYDGSENALFEWQSGSLDNTWMALELLDPDGESADLIFYEDRNDWVSSPDGQGPSLELRSPAMENSYFANWRASRYAGGTPGSDNSLQKTAHLYINELMASNQNYQSDENGEFDDWIEIYNGGDNPVDLGGFYITDDLSDPTLYQIPVTDGDATTIQPGDHLILWADQQPGQGVNHLDLALNSTGEKLGIVQVVDGKPAFIDSVSFGEQAEDVSFGRADDGGNIWEQFAIPTYDKPNSNDDAFKKGILLVNGVSFETYGASIFDSYLDRAFWGHYPIAFWDCFDAPSFDYPSSLPDPLGHGSIPEDILLQYSTVIWVGNNYIGDLAVWQQSDLFTYLRSGGNLILLTRLGSTFIDETLMNYLGIEWTISSETGIQNCNAVYPGLTNMELTGLQSFVDLFSINLVTTDSHLLFHESLSWQTPQGLGVWNQPENGGSYRNSGGQFVFISGRPYRYDSSDLRTNMEFILDNFFSELGTEDPDGPIIPTDFSLEQNYPNPFNAATKIRYAVPTETHVVLKIFNVLGQKVATLVNEEQVAGRKTITWYGRDDSGARISSGVYFYHLDTDQVRLTRKMVLLW